MSFYKVNVEKKEDAPVKEEGAEGVKIKWLIDKSVGAPTFAMRHFTVQPGGHTPLHKHDWEHEVYVLEGEGFVRHQDQEYPIQPGDAMFLRTNCTSFEAPDPATCGSYAWSPCDRVSELSILEDMAL
jgi:quercetin dioxygenase-like cupin family protein